MKAYELADEIDKLADAAELQTSHSHAEWHRNIANMLRQQADLIDVLKAKQKTAKELENKLWGYIRELEKKVIDLSFNLEYAKRTDEWVKKANEK